MKNHVGNYSNTTSKNSEKTSLIISNNNGGSDKNNALLSVVNNESNECLVKDLSTGSGESKHDNNGYLLANSLVNLGNAEDKKDNDSDFNKIHSIEHDINMSHLKTQVSSDLSRFHTVNSWTLIWSKTLLKKT